MTDKTFIAVGPRGGLQVVDHEPAVGYTVLDHDTKRALRLAKALRDGAMWAENLWETGFITVHRTIS